MTYAVQMIRSGRRHDHEDSRATHRIQATYAALAHLGVEPTITHGDRTYFDWATSREVHQCALAGSGGGDCKIVWPVWLTDELIDATWHAVSLAIAERGAYHREQARTAQRETAGATR